MWPQFQPQYRPIEMSDVTSTVQTFRGDLNSSSNSFEPDLKLFLWPLASILPSSLKTHRISKFKYVIPDLKDAKSSWQNCIKSLPDICLMSLMTSSALAWFLDNIMILAPLLAKSRTVSFPIPALPPDQIMIEN